MAIDQSVAVDMTNSSGFVDMIINLLRMYYDHLFLICFVVIFLLSNKLYDSHSFYNADFY